MKRLHCLPAWVGSGQHTCSSRRLGTFIDSIDECRILILWLVVIATRWDWHERSIEYRLLAELCRKQQTLAPLGWTLPIGAVERSVAADRVIWVAWLFAAYQRAAPVPQGDVALGLPEARRKELLGELIVAQLNYHHDRSEMAKRAAKTFVTAGGLSFLLVGSLVIVKFVMEKWDLNHTAALVLATAAIVLPGVSAAFIGIRDYGELQLLAEQSHHMEAELKRAKARLERLSLSRPLASQDLGAEAARVAMLMLQDLEGWTRLFRAKAVGPGA
jgi:hypothetical protein